MPGRTILGCAAALLLSASISCGGDARCQEAVDAYLHALKVAPDDPAAPEYDSFLKLVDPLPSSRGKCAAAREFANEVRAAKGQPRTSPFPEQGGAAQRKNVLAPTERAPAQSVPTTSGATGPDRLRLTCVSTKRFVEATMNARSVPMSDSCPAPAGEGVAQFPVEAEIFAGDTSRGRVDTWEIGEPAVIRKTSNSAVDLVRGMSDVKITVGPLSASVVVRVGFDPQYGPCGNPREFNKKMIVRQKGTGWMHLACRDPDAEKCASKLEGQGTRASDVMKNIDACCCRYLTSGLDIENLPPLLGGKCNTDVLAYRTRVRFPFRTNGQEKMFSAGCQDEAAATCLRSQAENRTIDHEEVYRLAHRCCCQ